MQNCRLGILLIHAGSYILISSSDLMLPLQDKIRLTKDNKRTAFDNNVCDTVLWKRWNYIAMAFVIIMFELCLIRISFNSLFSANYEIFIIVFKILGIFLESIIEAKLHDKMMLAPLSSTIGLIENLITFGAETFLAFLISFLLSLFLLLLERFYIHIVADRIFMW